LSKIRKVWDITASGFNVVLAGSIILYAIAAHAETKKVMDQLELNISLLLLDSQLECIATNIYHEARSESELGMSAVAWVTLNRVEHKQYPNSPCEVVYDAVTDNFNNPKKYMCQFSWYCDGKSDKIRNAAMWGKALVIASDILNNFDNYPDPTGGSHMYHANYVNPDWAEDYEKVVNIDNHIFYRDKK